MGLPWLGWRPNGGGMHGAAQRQTIVAHGRLPMRELRLAAARERRHGLQIMTFEQLAARLAGGMSPPVDDETLRAVDQPRLPDNRARRTRQYEIAPGMVRCRC